MIASSAEFKKKLDRARAKTEEAFTKLAKAYPDKKDLESTEAILTVQQTGYSWAKTAFG
jgi:hypothetical protein